MHSRLIAQANAVAHTTCPATCTLLGYGPCGRKGRNNGTHQHVADAIVHTGSWSYTLLPLYSLSCDVQGTSSAQLTPAHSSSSRSTKKKTNHNGVVSSHRIGTLWHLLVVVMAAGTCTCTKKKTSHNGVVMALHAGAGAAA